MEPPPIRLTLGTPHLSAGALVEYRRLSLTRLGEPRGHAVLSVSTPIGGAHEAVTPISPEQGSHVTWKLPATPPPLVAATGLRAAPPLMAPAARLRLIGGIWFAAAAASSVVERLRPVAPGLDPTSGEPRAVSALRVVSSHRPKRACSLRRCE